MSEKPQSTFYSLQSYHSRLQSRRYELEKIWNPSWFQGSKAKNQYFEGWYFKNVSENSEHCLSFIPGISLVGNNAHAFVQAINGSTGDTFYFRFPPESFSFSKKGFEVRIANNFFSGKGFTLDLNDGKNCFTGTVSIPEITGYKANLMRPGIMGWYRYVPFMECYHGVVSLEHELYGELNFNGQAINFDKGRGYIEKDWGSSMPESWIWMQTNHFPNKGTSFMLSVARIPWVGKTFTGFLGFFHHEGKTITFSTYTGAKIKELTYEVNRVHLQIDTGNLSIELNGENQSTGQLKAPVLGEMNRIIHESINATLNIKVSHKNGSTVYEGKGINAGLEMVGNLKLLKL
jgi:tocopherol cyclase